MTGFLYILFAMPCCIKTATTEVDGQDETDQLRILRCRRTSLLTNYTCAAIVSASLTSNDITSERRYRMPMKWPRRQYATYLTYFGRPENFGSAALRSELNVTVDRFRIFCKWSVTGQMLLSPQITNYLSRITPTTFLSSCFLLSYIDKAVAFLCKCRKLCLYLKYAIKIHSVLHSYPQI